MRSAPPVDLPAAVGARLDALLAELRAEVAPHPDALLALPMPAEGGRGAADAIRASRADAFTEGLLAGKYALTGSTSRPLTVGDALDLVERARAEVVAEVVAEIERCADALVEPKLRAAVLARGEVVARWPWPEWALVLDLLTAGYWPGAAAPLEVARWARDGLNAEAKRLGELDRPGDGLVLDAEHGWLPRSWTAREPVLELLGVEPLDLPADLDPDAARALAGFARRRTYGPPVPSPKGPPLRYPAAGLALLFLAERDARDSGRVPVVRVSASAASRAALAVLSAGTPERAPWDDDATRVSRTDGWAELVWNGRPRPLQLRLTFRDSEVVAAELVRGILAELQEDGVRDWLTLHRMAAEQGATGKVRWTWAEHRERTAYDRMIRSKNATDAELAAKVVGRLERMKGAELRWNVSTEGGKYAWARIGPFGLIDIPAGGGVLTDAGREQRVAKIVLNPAIYEGAARGSKAPHFALLPERALELPGPQLRLLAHLFLDFTYAGEADGVSRTAGKLWSYAGIQAGEDTPRKRWPDATRALARILDAVGDAVGWDWSREPGEAGEHPDTLYRVRPPAWWTDRVLRGVPADYGPSLASVPRTGAELKTWRTARGLSQREVAALVGVSQPTILRAEKRAEGPLDPDLAAALAPGVIQKGSTRGPLDSER